MGSRVRKESVLFSACPFFMCFCVYLRVLILIVAVAVFITLVHRHNIVRGHQIGSDHSGVNLSCLFVNLFIHPSFYITVFFVFRCLSVCLPFDPSIFYLSSCPTAQPAVLLHPFAFRPSNYPSVGLPVCPYYIFRYPRQPSVLPVHLPPVTSPGFVCVSGGAGHSWAQT